MTEKERFENKAIGAMLKRLRMSRGTKQSEFSWSTNIDVKRISRIECGTTPMRVTEVAPLAKALGLTPDGFVKILMEGVQAEYMHLMRY